MFTTLLDLLIKLITFDYFVIKKIISKYFNPNSHFSVLDLGCGTGALAKMFPPSSYLGFDLDEPSIFLAKRLNPNYKFKVADCTSPNLGKQKFDFILVSGVIHHLDDKGFKKTMMVIKTHLKPKGTTLLIEAVPPIYNWNILGKFIRSHDQGKHIRNLSSYVSQIQNYFRIVDSYQKNGGIVDYGVVVADNQLGKS